MPDAGAIGKYAATNDILADVTSGSPEYIQGVRKAYPEEAPMRARTRCNLAPKLSKANID